MKALENYFNGVEDVKLHSIIWEPDIEPVAVLQIIHGMTEHIGRYKELAEALTAHGIVVCGFSLRGHGKSDTLTRIKDVATMGENGWNNSLEEIRMFMDEIHSKYSELPYYMYGFSLGSFLLRDYLTKFKDDISGAIIAGTGNQSKTILNIIEGIIKKEVKNSGFDSPTELVNTLSFDTYNSKFKNTKTKYDWLCSNREAIRDYMDDDLCRKTLSAGLFYELLDSMKNNSSIKACKKWNTELPVLIIYGEEDPVGNFGKGIDKLIEQLEYAGVEYSALGIESARHDILHEENAEIAVLAIRDFILDDFKSSENENEKLADEENK